MAVLVYLVLFLALTGHSSAIYCVCKTGMSDRVLQKALDYACGAGADCSPILQSGTCYSPNTVKNHCDYAVNSYFQKKGQVQWSCDFSGTATTSQTAPTGASTTCVYPATTQTGTSTTPSTSPSTITPSTSPSTSPSTLTPSTSPSTTPSTITPSTSPSTTPSTTTPSTITPSTSPSTTIPSTTSPSTTPSTSPSTTTPSTSTTPTPPPTTTPTKTTGTAPSVFGTGPTSSGTTGINDGGSLALMKATNLFLVPVSLTFLSVLLWG